MRIPNGNRVDEGTCRPSRDTATRIAEHSLPGMKASTFLVALALCGLAPRVAAAAPPRKVPVASLAERDAEARPSLVGRTGVRHASELLAMGSVVDRLRGIERLGRIGTREALEALQDALAGGPVLNDPRTRLAAVQALAPHALQEEARLGLMAVVQHPLEDDLPLARGLRARDEAVFALARAAAGLVPCPPPPPAARDDGSGASVEERALTPLLAAVIGQTPVADVAERAVLRNPPADLGAFVRGVATATVPELRLLGLLGDPRAIPMLRRSLLREEQPVQTEAMLALARLGDHTALPLARAWAGAAPPSKGAVNEATVAWTVRRVAAVEALLTLGAIDAPAALVRLFADDATRTAGLALAERWPSSELVPALEQALAANLGHDASRHALHALRRIGDDASALVLAKLLASPEFGPSAALALAESSNPGSERLLSKALTTSSGASRLLVLRAWLVRAKTHGELPLEVARAYEDAAKSTVPRERSLGVFAAALLGRTELAPALSRATAVGDLLALAALVSACAARGPNELRELVPLATRALVAGPRARSNDPSPNELAAAELQRIDEVALGLVLLVLPEFGTAEQLAAWAEFGGPASLQAAYRLGIRDPRVVRERTDALLGGTSPLVRAHVALGLGESPEPAAAARLEHAYRFEAEASVRLAIVRALSLRSEPPRARVLGLASALDPDDEVRAAAESALRGARHVSVFEAGNYASWLALVTSNAEDEHALRARVVEHVGRSGLAIPTLSSPDGVALAFTKEDVVRQQVRPTR